MYKKPIVWSNFIYVIVSFISFNEIVILSGLLLTVGSTWMHIEMKTDSVSADWMGMFSFSFATLYYVSFPDLLMPLWLISIVVMMFFFDYFRHNYVLVGSMITISIIITMCNNFIEGILAGLFFGIALIVRQQGHEQHNHDVTHTIWHLLSGIGYGFLFMGGVF
jgi:hypothetical protein